LTAFLELERVIYEFAVGFDLVNQFVIAVCKPKEHNRAPSMRLPFAFVLMVACAIGCGFSVIAADQESQDEGEDSSAGLPDEYAKNYLVARSTVSPDKKFAVIYPTLEAEKAADKASDAERIKDYIVALQPFTIIKALDTKVPYFQHESKMGLSAEWPDDSAVGLITLDGWWGPQDVFLVEFRDGKLSRITNIAR